MADNKIPPTRGRPSEPAKEPKKQAATSEEVVALSHRVYFSGVERIKRAHSVPPSTATLREHRYTVAKAGDGTPTPKK